MSKRTSILKLVLLVTIMSLAFTNPSMANQGIKDKVLSMGYDQRIFNMNTISASQDNKIQIGIGQAPYEKEAEVYVRPYGVNFFIDGKQVKTFSFSFNDKDGVLVGEPVHWWIYFHIFEAGYFQPNTEHTFGFEYFWYNGYGWYDVDGTIVFRQIEAYSVYDLPFFVSE